MKMVLRVLILSCLCSWAFAREVYYLQRSPIALMMGDAFTSIADDEYTLFYNPAALGRNRGVTLSIINPDITVTNALTELDRFKDFPSSDAAAISDRLMGFPIHLHLGYTPGLKMDQIGLNYFANNSTNIMLRNAIHPSLDIDYRYDRGIIAGFAISQKNPGKTKGYSRTLSGASNHSLGFAVKRVSRDSLDQSYDLFGTKLLNLIASSDVKDVSGVKKSLGFGSSSAWGADVGWLSTLASTGKEFNFGLSVQNIGGLRFTGEKGENLVPDDSMSVNFIILFQLIFIPLLLRFLLTVNSILEWNLDFRLFQHYGAGTVVMLAMELC